MILKSFVLIEKEGRYLLIREAAKKWKGKWFLPGGKVELNETPEMAAHREVKEEAGCDVFINGIFYLRYYSGIFDRYLALYYSGSITGEETIKRVSDNHSLDVRWFTLEEIAHIPQRQKLLELLKSYNKNNIISPKNFQII